MSATFSAPASTTLCYGHQTRPAHPQRRVLAPARDAGGLPWATFHSLRDACASLLFAEGRNIAQVAAWLGHADPAFTLLTYVHLMDDGPGDAAFTDEAVGVGGRPTEEAPEPGPNAAAGQLAASAP